MSDGKGQDRNARIGLTRPAAGRLELKKAVETSMVRQSFSHGRSKAVAVEVKKTRPMMPAGGLAKPTPSHANTTGGAGVTARPVAEPRTAPPGAPAVGVTARPATAPAGPVSPRARRGARTARLPRNRPAPAPEPVAPPPAACAPPPSPSGSRWPPRPPVSLAEATGARADR